jgi:hypothetical protein
LANAEIALAVINVAHEQASHPAKHTCSEAQQWIYPRSI